MLTPDLKEFIESLNSNRVKYLVIGGYALAFHGQPRYTKDIDIWIECSPENAKSIIQALNDFGFKSLGLTETDFLVNDQIIRLGYPPNRIDLIVGALGVDFETCYTNRIEFKLDDIQLSLISIKDLIENKRATGRLQDLADIERLESAGEDPR